MNLCEIDPAEVYRWFMEIFIDSCDWAMVPNVYGMSTYADGGLITTKPYISGSSYLRRMGDWPQGDWAEIWDGLFWRFVHLHRDVFAENPRTRVLAHQLDRIGEERLERHLEVAEEFLRSFRRGDRSKGEVREDEGLSRNGAHRVL
jgi:deoxyribodipyrimidine photolyase-related protein